MNTFSDCSILVKAKWLKTIQLSGLKTVEAKHNYNNGVMASGKGTYIILAYSIIFSLFYLCFYLSHLTAAE